jgi:hypothetical protein
MSKETARARAEAVFKVVETTPETRADALTEYRATQQAELDKAARLRAMRMAVVAEKKTAGK